MSYNKTLKLCREVSIANNAILNMIGFNDTIFVDPVTKFTMWYADKFSEVKDSTGKLFTMNDIIKYARKDNLIISKKNINNILKNILCIDLTKIKYVIN